jgi:hypothetical protein
VTSCSGSRELLGYVVRDPTALAIAGWAATTAVWVAATVRRHPE